MAGGYDGAIRISTQIDQSGFNAGIKNIESSLSGIKRSLKSFAGAVGIAFGVAAVVNFGKTTIKAAGDAESAMRGLRSIVEGQGRSWKEAKGFLKEYISDGLMPLANATTAYKNLAMRGYSDKQIQQTMTALKDSATFGRQASLSLGEAVASATEGLKNENSILVDNAGVTKNVSMMWKDYAASIGVGVNSLTKQQKIQAEVNGILEETRFQTGDSAKALSTYNGLIMQLQFNFVNLKIAIGNALIPIARAVLPSINTIINALTKAMNLFAQFTTAIFGRQAMAQKDVATTATVGAKAENDLAKATDKVGKATEKAGKKAKGALASFDDLNILAKDMAENMGENDNMDTSLALDSGIGDAVTLGEGIEVSPTVQAAVDALLAVLAPLQEISFEELAAAFDRLKVAAEPITKALFEGLEWAYVNLFVPLARWTIEDLLPIFLDMLAGALKLLGAIIDAIAPAIQWLWDNLLSPIASWAGGVFLDAIKLITDAFGALTGWFKENSETIQELLIGIGEILLFLWENGFKPILEDLWVLFKEVFADVLDAVLGVASGILETLGGIIDFVIGVFTGDWKRAWEGVSKIFRGVWNTIASIVEGAINLITDAINWCIKQINRISIDVPEWVTELTGMTTFGFNIPLLEKSSVVGASIPRLATGAVIPPNAEFAAILGDQRNGRNLEAPEGLIRQIIREESARLSGGDVVINASGNIGQFIRFLNFELGKESNRRGKCLIRGV